MLAHAATANSFGLVEVLALVITPMAATLLTLVITRAYEATNHRRDRYAQAVQTIAAWAEFPYRIRRRVNDDPSTLAALANLGHDLQERMAYQRARFATEHRRLALAFDEARDQISGVVGPANREAWQSRPISSATEMNLGGWGPARECEAAILHLQVEIQRHFRLLRLNVLPRRKTRRVPAAPVGREYDQESIVEDESAERGPL